MKRYLAFAGLSYYPSGGMKDFVGQYDEIEEAKSAILNELREHDDYRSLEDIRLRVESYNWYHIYDTEQNCFV